MIAQILTDQPQWASSHLHPIPVGPFHRPEPEPVGDAVLKGLFDSDLCDLWAAPLPDGFPPWPVLMRREAPESQFDVLLRVARKARALPPALVAVAGSGMRFHGAHGRPWVAVEGNLHVCVLFSLDPPRPLSPVLVTPLVVNAMAQVVEALPGFGGRVGIKWVNDLLVDQHKVGGALASTLSQGAEVGTVLVGFGLNVAKAPSVERSRFTPPVCALQSLQVESEASGSLPLGALFASSLRALASGFSRWVADPVGTGEAIVAEYCRRSSILGTEVEVVEEEPATPKGVQGGGGVLARGRVRAIGPGLELYIDGMARPVTQGRLRWPLPRLGD